MQSKKLSLIESITNTAIGFGISLAIQVTLFPLMNIPVSFGQNIFITIVFTAASIGRGYVVRRFFTTKNKI